MGRFESLAALALGRGPFEDEVVEPAEDLIRRPTKQKYNEHGHPRNPETKRREREHVRAANEVMLVTGVVEDALASKVKAEENMYKNHRDTFTGLRFMEYGRAVLVAGVWGVLGIRRRILLYKPYSSMRLLEIMRHETVHYGPLYMIGAGLPCVFVYHVGDFLHFLIETYFYLDEEENGKDLIWKTRRELQVKHALSKVLEISFSYVAIHFQMFSILQQLGLIPASRLFPSLLSFVPFSMASPLHILPSLFPAGQNPVISWGDAIVQSLMPMAMILLGNKVRGALLKFLYTPIYRLLPRPIDDTTGLFSILSDTPPAPEFDGLSRSSAGTTTSRSEDEPTLRALEGLPVLERMEPRSRPHEQNSDSGIDDDNEVTHATLISFDVEPSETIETNLEASGTWSAELRSSIEVKPTSEKRYRVTGLTLLPPITATECLRDIVSGILLLPIDALIVRIIGRAYRFSAGVGMEDMYPLSARVGSLTGVGNIISVFVLHLGVTGIVWSTFTIGSQTWAAWYHGAPSKDKVAE